MLFIHVERRADRTDGRCCGNPRRLLRMCFKSSRRMLSESNFTKCTEDDGSTSKFLASSHGSDDQLILRVSPEAAQRDCFAVSRDHRHHPVTNHNSVTPPCHLTFQSFRLLSLISIDTRYICILNTTSSLVLRLV